MELENDILTLYKKGYSLKHISHLIYKKYKLIYGKTFLEKKSETEIKSNCNSFVYDVIIDNLYYINL